MHTIVVKPFLANGTFYESGTMVNTTEFPKEMALINARYLRPATPQEVMDAAGLELPSDMMSRKSSTERVRVKKAPRR